MRVLVVANHLTFHLHQVKLCWTFCFITHPTPFTHRKINNFFGFMSSLCQCKHSMTIMCVNICSITWPLFLFSLWLSQYLELLLSQVCEIVEKHHEECVLEACVRVLCALCCDQYTFSVRVERVISQILDSVLERLNTHLADIMQVIKRTPYWNTAFLTYWNEHTLLSIFLSDIFTAFVHLYCFIY